MHDNKDRLVDRTSENIFYLPVSGVRVETSLLLQGETPTLPLNRIWVLRDGGKDDIISVLFITFSSRLCYGNSHRIVIKDPVKKYE